METTMKYADKTKLFNGPLEAGVRSVVLLHAAMPASYDLNHLIWMDHLVVHTNDLPGGPPSLHPDIPQRSGELLVRRSLVENGLNLMKSLHMIEVSYTNEGIYYAATEQSSLFIQLVRTGYGQELKQRAEWLVEYITKTDPNILLDFIQEKVGRWAIEFQSETNL